MENLRPDFYMLPGNLIWLSGNRKCLSWLVSKGCKLVGCGSATPTLKVSNDDLAKIVDTSDEWISVRTGIRNRRVLSGKDSLTTLAVEAARKALEMAQVDPDDVDLVLMCTSTPEDLFGSAPQIQKALGCKRNPLAYDITAACSGFVLGLVSAACHIRGGGFQNVLVIGADALSRYVDWTDRGTCILFGDAAGAVLVQDLLEYNFYKLFVSFGRASCPFNCRFYTLSFILEISALDATFAKLIQLFTLPATVKKMVYLVLTCIVMVMAKGTHLNATMKENEMDKALGSNGSVLGFPPRRSSYSCIQMNGKEVFRFAVRCVPQTIESSLEKAGLPGSSIDWLLLHQANQRILDAVATRLEVPPEQVISNLANYGNTSAASIPLALDEAVRSGKVKAGHTIAAAGFGAGLTWGSAIFRWG
ncbi:3-oxoacyl-[acyl-carrier-protein] synthase 3 A, chloroplastic [Morella rubra]|uniref:3-oxoacyl-[acyl-carrier-protein] synthase 3 A, chloroplastic n=1 Tax=Morella rubra TaxID=262757 RepID=A0A6A1VVQ7_9ROSI|nr:3-oxoacyl-[acyl-carrier-protein] synthase 3 A, chloroplastic [Morella rubra]